MGSKDSNPFHLWERKRIFSWAKELCSISLWRDTKSLKDTGKFSIFIQLLWRKKETKKQQTEQTNFVPYLYTFFSCWLNKDCICMDLNHIIYKTLIFDSSSDILRKTLTPPSQLKKDLICVKRMFLQTISTLSHTFLTLSSTFWTLSILSTVSKH